MPSSEREGQAPALPGADGLPSETLQPPALLPPQPAAPEEASPPDREQGDRPPPPEDTGEEPAPRRLPKNVLPSTKTEPASTIRFREGPDRQKPPAPESGTSRELYRSLTHLVSPESIALESPKLRGSLDFAEAKDSAWNSPTDDGRRILPVSATSAGAAEHSAGVVLRIVGEHR